MKRPGFIKLWRKVTDCESWSREGRIDLERLGAWTDLLLMASWAAHTVVWLGVRINLDRGQFMTSERHLGQRWNWSTQKVARFLHELEDAEMIQAMPVYARGTTTRKRIGTLIDVRKWGEYQGGPAAHPGSQPTRSSVLQRDPLRRNQEGEEALTSSSVLTRQEGQEIEVSEPGCKTAGEIVADVIAEAKKRRLP